MKPQTENELKILEQRYPALLLCDAAIHQATEMLISCWKNGGKLMICGNGGSAADSLHIVGELQKAFVLPRTLPVDDQRHLETMFGEDGTYLAKNLQGALPAISFVSEVGLSTAYANDVAADLAFAQQTYGQGRAGDVLLGISTSGNSKNVVYAAEVAKSKGINVIGLTGSAKSRLSELADVNIAVPSTITYQIQEYHLPIYHALCLAAEQEFFS